MVAWDRLARARWARLRGLLDSVSRWVRGQPAPGRPALGRRVARNPRSRKTDRRSKPYAGSIPFSGDLPMHRTAVSLMTLALGLRAANFAAKGQTPAAPVPSTVAAAAEPAWVVRSNQYTQMLLDVQFKHSPEGGSGQEITKYDPLITDATRADEI